MIKTKKQYRELLEAQLHKRKMLNAALLGGALIGGAANPTQAANTPGKPPTVNTAEVAANAKNKQRARFFAAASLAVGAASLLAGRIKGSRRSE